MPTSPRATRISIPLPLAIFTLVGAYAHHLPNLTDTAHAQGARRTQADQAVMGPGLYVFQTRLTDATCGDISGSGYVNSYVAEIQGVPGDGEMHMNLPNSDYWPRWEVRVMPNGHVGGTATVDDSNARSSSFDVSRREGQFTGRGSRTYTRLVDGQRRRCTVEFDTLLRRIDR